MISSITQSSPEPPAYLTPSTQEWFKQVCSKYEFESHHVKLLEMAAQSWDEFELARDAMAENGLTFSDRYGQPRERPEVGIARQARTSFSRLIRELALDVEPPPESTRIPRFGGQSR